MEEENITRALRILEGSGVGVLEWQFQKNALFICANFFSTLNEPVPKSPAGLWFFWRRLHHSDRKLVASSIKLLLQKPGMLDIEFRLKNSSGKYIWVHAQGQVFTDKDGAPEYLTASITNIDEKKSAIERLRLSEERLRSASEFAEIILWQVNAEYGKNGVTRHFWWSDSFYTILGYDKSDVAPSEDQFFRLVHTDDVQRIVQSIQLPDEGDTSLLHFEFRLKHKTDGYVWVRCLGHREKLADGKYRGLGAVININDLKLAQEEARVKNQELKLTNEELEQFAYAASHDLKAPLRGLKSLATWIDEDLDNPSEVVSQNLRLMKHRVSRMENLLSDILAYSRAGRRNQAPEEINLRSLIDEIWDYVNPPEGFHLNIELGKVSLSASKTLLEQTFSNLLSNAIKHHDRSNGQVNISYSLNSDHHYFSVMDDGPGIDPKYQDKIFQIFQTLRPRDEVEGSGVGLAIVKRTIDSSGGSVWLEASQGERGACFNFTLPLDTGTIATERESLGLFDNAP